MEVRVAGVAAAVVVSEEISITPLIKMIIKFPLDPNCNLMLLLLLLLLLLDNLINHEI
jgi:hypothetical protein